MWHDYPPQHRKPSPQSTVGAQKWHNIHVREGISQEEFVSVREKRDATLAMPRLLLPSLQVNIRARSEEHTSELQSRGQLVCRLLLEKKQKRYTSRARE